METNEHGAVIAAGTIVKGRLIGDEDLVVAGRVEGRVEIRGRVVIEEGAVVAADVVADEVHIAGLVVGRVEASRRILISASGRVAGDLHAPALRVDPGARIRGAVEMDDGEARDEAAAPVQDGLRRREVDDALTALENLRTRIAAGLPRRREVPTARPAPIWEPEPLEDEVPEPPLVEEAYTAYGAAPEDDDAGTVQPGSDADPSSRKRKLVVRTRRRTDRTFP